MREHKVLPYGGAGAFYLVCGIGKVRCVGDAAPYKGYGDTGDGRPRRVAPYVT
ncbi:MAG: hypothetical protein AB9835_12450 [Eubacteriales bacterium]